MSKDNGKVTPKNRYWGDREEQAIRSFIASLDEKEKHQIYASIIEPAFKLLIENIFHVYNFSKTLPEFSFVQQDLLVYLYERIGKFHLDGPGRAFSYFGTVVKHWLIQQSVKAKRTVHSPDNETGETLTTDASNREYEITTAKESVSDFVDEIARCLPEIAEEQQFNSDDLAVMEIVVEVLRRRVLFDISNKRQLYVFLKEATDLPTRRITKSLNKIKDAYEFIRHEHLN